MALWLLVCGGELKKNHFLDIDSSLRVHERTGIVIGVDDKEETFAGAHSLNGCVQLCGYGALEVGFGLL